jgi:hypothetical protein
LPRDAEHHSLQQANKPHAEHHHSSRVGTSAISAKRDNVVHETVWNLSQPGLTSFTDRAAYDTSSVSITEGGSSVVQRSLTTPLDIRMRGNSGIFSGISLPAICDAVH